MPLALLALAIGALEIGTTFVIMGLLPQVGADLGVSVPTGGYLVTGHALGVIAPNAPPKPTMSMTGARPPRRLIGAQLAGGAPKQGHGSPMRRSRPSDPHCDPCWSVLIGTAQH
ncbi:hypothetical protein RKD27_000138 [Streptomyces sp. SAI-126]